MWHVFNKNKNPAFLKSGFKTVVYPDQYVPDRALPIELCVTNQIFYSTFSIFSVFLFVVNEKVRLGLTVKYCHSELHPLPHEIFNSVGLQMDSAEWSSPIRLGRNRKRDCSRRASRAYLESSHFTFLQRQCEAVWTEALAFNVCVMQLKVAVTDMKCGRAHLFIFSEPFSFSSAISTWLLKPKPCKSYQYLEHSSKKKAGSLYCPSHRWFPIPFFTETQSLSALVHSPGRVWTEQCGCRFSGWRKPSQRFEGQTEWSPARRKRVGPWWHRPAESSAVRGTWREAVMTESCFRRKWHINKRKAREADRYSQLSLHCDKSECCQSVIPLPEEQTAPSHWCWGADGQMEESNWETSFLSHGSVFRSRSTPLSVAECWLTVSTLRMSSAQRWTHHAVVDKDLEQPSREVPIHGWVQGELRQAQRQHVARLRGQCERLGGEGRLAVVLPAVELPLQIKTSRVWVKAAQARAVVLKVCILWWV